MFDHTNTIRRLTEVQKIRLLTDIHSLEEPELHALGVPQVRCGSPQDPRGEAFPAPAVLARSWDKALLSDVAELRCRSMAGAGLDHIILPEAKVRLTPFGEGLSEDPVLAGELVSACLTGANRAGLPASLAGYGFAAREAEKLDAPLAPRARYTFLDLPYTRALGGGSCTGLVIQHATESLPEGDFGWTFCQHAEGEETVIALTRGQICMKGSASAVQSALHNYRRFQTAIEHGRATTGELEEACARGEAISEETLNESLVRLLDFARQCADRASVGEVDHMEAEELRRRAILSSAVLLENRSPKNPKRGILPLKPNQKVCIIGDMASAGGHSMEEAAEMLKAGGYPSVTFAQGYDRRHDRDDQLLETALAEAKKADVVILLLGMDAEQERRSTRERRCALPANQLALCDGVSRLDRAVVAVISSCLTPDLSFLTTAVHPYSAVLLAPLEEPEGLSVVAEILRGKSSPSGRLPVTLCARDETPELFRECRRVGPFVGYRYYDSLGYGALYPFGHGLTYTSFHYANLRISGRTVSFTVRNVGRRAGVETAQVYLGMPSSNVLRPTKELVAFERVELAPGASRKITLSLEIPPICAEDGSLLTERGTYTLFVGASVSDIRLRGSLTGGVDTLPADGERSEDYLSSRSNIHSHHYLMEAEYLPMKPSLRNLLFGIVALCLAASVKIYDVVTSADAMFLNIVAGILAVGAILFFASDILDRRKQHAAERARMEEANTALFADAAKIPAPSAAELFAVEDEWERTDGSSDSEEKSEGGGGEYDYFADVDKSLTFSEAAEELATLAREKGITVSESTLRSIFSALSVSNLAVVYGMSNIQFSTLISLLGEYFGCLGETDTVDGSYHSESDVLFANDAYGNRAPRNALRALLAAQREPGKIHLAALNNVDPATMSAYFVPYARHAHAPGSGCTVECHGGYGEEGTYRLSENLWFIVNLKPGTSPCQLPDYVSEIATVNCWSLEGRGTAAGGHSEFRHFGYGQMDYLRDRLRGDFSVDEEIWKKIDRLESYAARYADFRIGNKHWLGMEMYMAVLMSFGADESSARDEAMAVKLMPSLTAVLSGRIPREERSLSETLDALFGDDQTALCRKAVKESGADLA